MRLSPSSEPADVDIDQVNLSDPLLYSHGDPHSIWAKMREEAPIRRHCRADGRSFVSITRYADVIAVARDHERFTSRGGTVLSILGMPDPAADKMLVASDPPIHTAIREPLTKVLSRRALEPFIPEVQRVVHMMLEPILAGEPFDLAHAIAPFPMAFAGILMGIPPEDWPALTRQSTSAIAPDDPDYRTGNGSGTLASAHHELFSYLSRASAKRAKVPGEDLISFFQGITINNRRLRHDEVVYNCYSMLLGANVTTPHTVTGTIAALAENPVEYDKIVDAATVQSAVEEGLRWSTPTIHFMRHVLVDTRVGDVDLRAGEAVVLWLASANRDIEAFPDPFRFSVTRKPNRHVAFGFGPHFCVGAPLARIALRLLFEEICKVVERFEVVGPIVHLGSNFVGGMKSMPILARLRPGASDVIRQSTARR
ncbi:cytochrome P450 [Sphingomonas sp. 1185]|uniref:cytochrome P450 n=1 Tax=Sphingomonas sp. 1185 TaxID=3156411 RepID=UPI0033953172